MTNEEVIEKSLKYHEEFIKNPRISGLMKVGIPPIIDLEQLESIISEIENTDFYKDYGLTTLIAVKLWQAVHLCSKEEIKSK